MDRSTVVETVKRVLAEITHNADVIGMSMDTSLKDDLSIDSMTSLVFLMALEDNVAGFVVDADTLEVEHFSTINSICDYVMLQLARSAEFSRAA
jgi:acyl carrier protein